MLAAYVLDTGRDPASIHADAALRRNFQRRLAAQGVPLCWVTDVGAADSAFAAVQMAAVTSEVEGAPDSLETAALPASARARLWL